MVVEIIFWISFLLLFYTFIAYPLGIRMLAAIVGKRTQQDKAFLPSVSIILSVYNEEEVIEAKIANFLAIDYPEEKLEMIIVSDCCSDRTDELIQKHVSQRIHLVVQTERSGKTKNLNKGVTKAQGEVVVFTDANSMFDKNALKKLVSHFFDPTIGLVSGKSVYFDDKGYTTSGGAYRRYEDFIKDSESRLGGIIGADGAIYALRKYHYTPLLPEYINDFIHTSQVILAGAKAINDSQAICREKVKEVGHDELQRQTRIMSQSWLIFLSQFWPLFRKGKLIYLWQFISHKFLRWLTFPLIMLLFGTSFCLMKDDIFYQTVFVSQLFFFLSVALGSQMECKVFRIPYFFTLLHYAAMLGLIKLLTGTNYTIWNPRGN